MANKMTRPLLIASLLSGAAGFKFMSNFKMPTIQGQLREQKAEAKSSKASQKGYEGLSKTADKSQSFAEMYRKLKAAGG